MLLMHTPRQWLRVCLAKNWVPLLTLTALWLPSLFLLLDVTGCVWRILMCHCTSGRSQLPLMKPCFSTFSQQHLSRIPGPFCLPCPMLVISSMEFHLPHWSGYSPSGPGVSTLAYTLLAWSASTLLLLLLPWMPQYSWSFWWPPGWLWGQQRQDHQAQCCLRCHLYSAAQCAALAPVKKMPNLISDSLSKPADVFLTTWSCGQPAALDVHVISSFNNKLWEKHHPLLAMSCKLVLSALSSHAPLNMQISWTMNGIYCGCDGSLGGFTEDSNSILCFLGKSIGHRLGCPVCTKQLFHRTAIALAWCSEMPPTIYTLWLHR